MEEYKLSDGEIMRVVEAVKQAMDCAWDNAIAEEAAKGNSIAKRLLAKKQGCS